MLWLIDGEHNEAIRSFGERHPNQYHFIGYEDMLSEPEIIMRRISSSVAQVVVLVKAGFFSLRSFRIIRI